MAYKYATWHIYNPKSLPQNCYMGGKIISSCYISSVGLFPPGFTRPRPLPRSRQLRRPARVHLKAVSEQKGFSMSERCVHCGGYRDAQSIFNWSEVDMRCNCQPPYAPSGQRRRELECTSATI